MVECSTTKPCPPSEYIAPRAKSFWPPDDEKYVPSIVSDAHWPRKSTVSVALTDTKFGSLAMIRGSFTYRTACNSIAVFSCRNSCSRFGAEGERADRLGAVQPLAHPVDDARLDQVDHAVGQQLGVHAEIAMVAQRVP